MPLVIYSEALKYGILNLCYIFLLPVYIQKGKFFVGEIYYEKNYGSFFGAFVFNRMFGFQ